jgi:DNA-binding beta-propeller fold protein YncE
VSSATAQAAEPPGSLTQPPPPQACFDNDGADGCTAFVAPNRINDGFSGLAFGPEGKQLFTTAQSGGGVTFLRDAATGDLSTQPVPQGLAPFSSLAVAPDGRHLFYGASRRSRAGGVTVMKRSASTGFIEGAPASCFEDLSDPVGSCGQAPGLKDVEGVAISPDGKTLYAAASQGGASDAGTRSGRTAS